MAHFARLDDNNIVTAVHVLNNEVIMVDGIESEQAGVDFLAELHKHSNWKQTSYNGSFRKNFAGIGHRYDAALDAFIAPAPFGSWVLNEDTCIWEPPVDYPQDGGRYVWDETTTAWVEIL